MTNQKHISAVVDIEISAIETTMDSTGKHIISSDTLRERVVRHVNIHDINEDRQYLMQIGLTQVIQSRLQNRGYRSVRRGYFVNLTETDNIQYLNELLQSSDLTVKEKIEVKARIVQQMKKKFDGQSELVIVGSEIVGIREMPSEKQFMEMLVADAV